jgi:hypothetical protein
VPPYARIPFQSKLHSRSSHINQRKDSPHNITQSSDTGSQKGFHCLRQTHVGIGHFARILPPRIPFYG